MKLWNRSYLAKLLLFGSFVVPSMIGAQDSPKPKPAPSPRQDCGNGMRACAKGIRGANCVGENDTIGRCVTLHDNECQCITTKKGKGAAKKGKDAAKPTPSPAPKN